MIYNEPFRLFFPLGIALLFVGAGVWLPLLWTDMYYPVAFHRVVMINGFLASFIGGFLMTAIPRFSQTSYANKFEVFVYLAITLTLLLCSFFDFEKSVLLFSAFQSIFLLIFAMRRMRHRKNNPPFSFIFLFIGLFLWPISSILSLAFPESEFNFLQLHYEAAVGAIIMGVGTRLVPGILNGTMAAPTQSVRLSLIKLIPLPFLSMMLVFIFSYILGENSSLAIHLRSIAVFVMMMKYWDLTKVPQIKTSLNWCLWGTGWMIFFSFLLKSIWISEIHVMHSFFLAGIVAISLFIATRVVQSHCAKNPALENWKGLYVIFALLVLSASTRVTAFLFPEIYLKHLAYSAFVLYVAVGIWGWKFLRLISLRPN